MNTSKTCEINNGKEKEKNKRIVSKKKKKVNKGCKRKCAKRKSAVKSSELSVNPNAKEESMELRSVSQVESKPYIASLGDMECKLKQMEGIPCEQKVSIWLEDVNKERENLGSYSKDQTDSFTQQAEGSHSGMIKTDYGDSKLQDNRTEDDPYEFVPSQKTKVKSVRKSPRLRKKTVPEFEAIQSFNEFSPQKNLAESKADTPLRGSSPIFKDTNSEILKKTSKTYSTRSNLSKTITLGASEERKKENKECSEGTRLISDTYSNDSILDKLRSKSRRRLLQTCPVIDSDGSCEASATMTPIKTGIDSLVTDNYSESECSGKSNGGPAKKKKKKADVPSKCSESPGWSRVSNLKYDFEAVDRRTRYLRRSLNISGGERNLSSKSRSVEALPESESNNNRNSNDDVCIEDSSQRSEPLVGYDNKGQADIQDPKKSVEVTEEKLKGAEKCKIDHEKEANVQAVASTASEIVPEPVERKKPKTLNRKTIPFTLLGKIQKKKKSSTLFVKLGRLSAIKARSQPAIVKIIFPSTMRKVRKPVRAAAGCQTDLDEETSEMTKKKDNVKVRSQTIKTCAAKEVQTSEIERKSVAVQTGNSGNLTLSEIFKDFNAAITDDNGKMDGDIAINTELQSELNKPWVTQEQINSTKKKKSAQEELVDLDSIDSDSMGRVMENINVDLERVRAVRSMKPTSQHRDEESDSDVFIEQTPPKNNSVKKNVEEEELQISYLMISGVPEQKSALPCDENNGRQTGRNNNINRIKKPAKEKHIKRLCISSSGVVNRMNIDKFVKKFGVKYLSIPTKDITHLVVGLHENDDDERVPHCTPKLLFAIANKKWIVSEEWIEKCLKMNMLVPEEPFESVDPAGGNGCARARVSSGLLLENCEAYLMGKYDGITKEEFSVSVQVQISLYCLSISFTFFDCMNNMTLHRYL